MNIYHVRPGSILPLGKQGENMARKIQFDISRWIGTFGPGTVQLLHQRNGDEAPYPVAVEQEGNLAVWTVTSSDTAAAGTGRAELQYYVGDALAKSETWMTKVLPALGDASETPPEAQQGWVDQVLAQVARITGMTAQAVGLPAGSAPTADYADGVLTIGIPMGAAGQDGAPGQDGITPTIGDNGNWYLGDTDTGKPSRGETGQAGADGRDGADGQPGADGKSAYQYAAEGGYTGTEEAFAEKLSKEMPDKLPNPNALTFTGAVNGSYDGSAPFEVAIPSGGGGLTVTNTASVGQTVKITAVDENGRPTEWEAVDMAEQVQPDWNQNDSTQPDYVKNRTHYEESIYTDYVLNMGATEIVGLLLLEVGETMTVKINGVDSVETVKEAESSILGFSYKYIGNTDIDSLFNGGTGWIVAEALGQTMGFANPDTTITVGSIVVHKINDKFINFDRFAQTFDYYFKNYTIYKPLYKDDGSKCELYTCNNFILPKSDSQLFGFMGELGLSYVGRVNANSCFVGGAAISTTNGNIDIKATVFGTSPTEMERIAADYGYTLTTKPNA